MLTDGVTNKSGCAQSNRLNLKAEELKEGVKKSPSDDTVAGDGRTTQQCQPV
ncbi:hypothetical protein THAOC_18997, partial [Thalassiosira oceanica]